MNVILLYSLLLFSVVSMNHLHQGLGPVTRLGPAEYEEHSTATHGRSWVGRYLTEVPRGTKKKSGNGLSCDFFWTFVCFCQNEVSRVGKKTKKPWITWILWTQKLHWHLKKLLDSADRFNSYQTPMEAMSSGPSPGGHWHRKTHRRLGLYHIPSGKRLQ